MKIIAAPIFNVLSCFFGRPKIRVGEAYTQKGHPKRAVSILTDALKDSSLTEDQTARGSMALGLAYLQLRQPNVAILHLDKSAVLRPKREKAWLLLGMAHHEKGDIPGAIESYMRGIEAQPKSVQLHWELGTSLLMADRTEESVKVLKTAVKLEPYEANLWADLAHAQVRIGAFEEARESGEQAVSLNPDSHEAFYTLGDAWAGLGDRAKARAQYENAINREPMYVPALYRLALLAQADQLWGKAIGFYAKTLLVEPDHLRAKGRLDACLLELKNQTSDVQIRSFEEVIVIEEHYLLAYEELGRLRAEQKEYNAAIKVYEQLRTKHSHPAKIRQQIRKWKTAIKSSNMSNKK